jgi:hypothetical protein
MKRILLLSVFFLGSLILFAQQPGDTIVVSAFKYGSTSRDTLISFPGATPSIAKILMKYNMRCKNALISNSSAPNQGCGEWDYSCNTFIVDSAHIEELLSTHPTHTITNYTGTNFKYTTDPLVDYYRFRQISVSLDSIITESQIIVGTGNTPLPEVLKTNEQSGKSYILFTAAELLSAGFSAGNIDGILLSVANPGGAAHFFRMGVKHTLAQGLNADSSYSGGFTQVFNRNYTFGPGSNRIQFYTPFVWDGVSSILFEFSFTNTVPGNPIVLNGHSTSGAKTLFANNNYALDLSSAGLVTMNTSQMGTIGNELSVGFWSYGYPDLLPANTSILYGYAGAAGQRHLNIHLPWANGSVYFDCGFSGSYDRIFKPAVAAEYEGQWNQWVFTKNASTGNMSIYLNGALWHSGTGMTKPISLLNLMLGNNNTLTNNYKGKINELTIWDKALTANEVLTWKNKQVDSTHPSWANLVAYYKMDEGTGASIADVRNNVTSSGINMQWGFDRGDKLSKLFAESSLRPNVVLLRGVYDLDTASIFVIDSVPRSPNVVNEYTIVPAPAGVLQDDAVTLVSTTPLFQAIPLKMTDGDADTLLYSIIVVPEDSIQITTMNYFRRYPYYNEIMSFVTPYGLGLDLGAAGKTWYFDVTDFTPLLKGNKRLMMTGGIWQEDLDIDFLFIVGTPAREVLDFRQLWQGSARAGNATIASINNQNRFPAVAVPLLAGGEAFKIRATITGHGSEGEFHNNGGIINHYFSVNSSSNDFSWQITEECSFNPVFPQGGTWVYDRQGWCPGQYSLLKELDITPLVTPGTTATLDYNCSSPPVTTGDYRYIAAFQLVTYGAPNHLLDAEIVEIQAPTNLVVHSRKNPVCAHPKLMIRNTGATPITSIEFQYWLNSASTKQTYTWTGNLASMHATSITLPTGTLWNHGYFSSGNTFHAEILRVNGLVDDYPFNNRVYSPFSVTDKIPGKFVIEFKTNNLPTHNTYTIVDEAGTAMPGASLLSTANTIYRDTFDLDGCYTLVVTDAGQDGLQWWANTAQGTGYVRIKSATGTVLKTFQADFGGGFEYSFTTQGLVAIEENAADETLSIYPNPASDRLVVMGNLVDHCEIALADLLGRPLEIPAQRGSNHIIFSVSDMSPGVYLVVITRGSAKEIRRVVIQ